MSEQRAIVERVLGAFNRRDVEAALRLTDPEIDFFAPETGSLARQPYHHYPGHEGIRLYFDDVVRVWERLQLEPREFREADDCVVVLGRVRGRTRAGQTVEEKAAWAWRIRDGKIVWGRVYANASEALREAGAHDAPGEMK